MGSDRIVAPLRSGETLRRGLWRAGESGAREAQCRYVGAQPSCEVGAVLYGAVHVMNFVPGEKQMGITSGV